MSDPDFSALNRYHDNNKYGGINLEGIALTKKFVQNKLKEDEKLPRWAERFKEHFTVSGDKLMLDGKEVIAKEKRDETMRNLVYDKDSKIGLARDAGYYQIQKRYWNIPRRKWQAFLKKQESLRKTDNLPPRQKAGGKKLKRKGEIEVDVFVITHKDLKDHTYLQKKASRLGDEGKKLDYKVLNAVDRLTSYCKTYMVNRADAATVKTAVKKSLKFFQDLLELKREDIMFYSDAGAEFASWTWTDINVKHEFVSVGNKVEQKNSHLQRIFHRLKNSNRMSSVTDGLRQSEDIANASYNRILKMSPAEAVKKYNGPAGDRLMELYNNARKKGDEDRRGKLEVGMNVRKVTRKTKHASDYTFVKAYHGKTFTKDTFEIKKVVKRGDNYLYQLKDGTNKFYRRDRISENTPAADQKSNLRIKANRKRNAPPTPPPSPEGVKTRAVRRKEAEAARIKAAAEKAEREKRERELEEKYEEKEAEAKPESKKPQPKKKPEVKKPKPKEEPKAKPKESEKHEPDNVIEEHEKAVLKRAPSFNSKVRYHQANKWLLATVPATQRLQRKEWMSRDDLQYVERWIKKMKKFLVYMKKHMRHDRGWKKWLEKRFEDLEDVDEALNQVNSAEGDNKKPTWKVERQMHLQAHKIGKPAKPIYYPKGSKYAI